MIDGMLFLTLSSAIGLLIALAVLGFLLMYVLHGELDWLEMIALSFPLGAGVFTYALFLFSWAGLRLDALQVIAIYTGIIVVLGSLIRILSHAGMLERGRYYRVKARAPLKEQILPLIPIIMMVSAAGVLAVLRAYSSWDAIGIWAIKGFGIANEGNVRAAGEWGSHGLSYPLNIPLQISIFRLVTTDSLPGSKLIFPMYYFALFLGTYTYIKDRTDWKMGMLAALFLATIPIIFEHATIGYANLPFTACLSLGLMAAARGFVSGDHGRLFIGGMLLGIASWTRPEGVFLIAPMLIVVLIASSMSGKLDGRSNFIFVFVPFLILITLWQVFMVLNGSQGLFRSVLRSAREAISSGDLQLPTFYWTARYAARQIIDPGVWGLTVPIGSIVLLVRWRSIFSKIESTFIYFILPAITGALALFAYYYLASFGQNIHYLLGTSVNRLFMPVWILLILAMFSHLDTGDVEATGV